MIEAIGITLLNIGAILGFWGFVWRLWDNRAMASGVLMGIGIVAVIIGEVLT